MTAPAQESRPTVTTGPQPAVITGTNGAAGSEHRLGPLEAIPVGEGRAYAVDGEQVAVFRLHGGAVRAVQAVCPHLGGPLADGQIDQRVVMCPLHGWTYDLTTGACVNADAVLRTFPVRVEAGELVLTLPD